jgi:pyruvate dehydrogenase E2 component (dihydrolipoamide acetyltransferase)
MTRKQFKLPDLGEGLTEGEILRWLVQVGDEVKLNQPIVEVETAKAAVEVPSPYAGVVAELHHGEGETVDVGTPIITVDTEPGAQDPAAEVVAAGAAANPKETGAPTLREAAATTQSPGIPATLVENPPDDQAVEPGLIGGPAPGGRTSVLVGYGPKSVTAKRRPRRPEAVAPPSQAQPPTPPARVSAAAVGQRAAVTAGEVAILAKPPVRKLARDLGVDLSALAGTGPAGTITRADVEAAADGAASPQPAATPAALGFDPASRESRLPVKGVRKMTAEAMVASAFTAPHVTEFLTLDVTPMMETVARLKSLPDFAGVRVSPLLLVAKALLTAVRRHPVLNSSWDGDRQEIVVKDYVNLGIAAATPRGLLVPNVKDAGSLSLVELARALGELADTARAGKTAPGDMQHGTITITNVGVFGVDTGTPIINPGESAILAFGAVRPMPWAHEGALAVRQVTTLALSFDHRVIDGQQGSEFLRDLGALLADPGLFLAWG